MSYTALYRKFRPTTFEDVRGQDNIVTTLRNQVATGRVGHAFLFTGTRGIGKTTAAKLLARAVNCENPNNGDPCGVCPMCRAILDGTSMNVIEIDAASNNGVENIRTIIDEVQYAPTEGNYKVYIVDEVHMLSTSAFNALLKTLEEPPSYVIFILATTEIHKIPITILSRCQRYDFKRATMEEISGRLRELCDKENILADDRALHYIAVVADGSFRDGISLLDQCVSFYPGEELTYDRTLEVLGTVDVSVFGTLMEAIRRGNVTGTLQIIDEVVATGRELTQFTVDFTWYLRNLLVAKAVGPTEINDIPTDYMPAFMNEVQANEASTLERYIQIVSDLTNTIRFSSSKRVLIEVAMIRLCKPESEKTPEALKQRIDQLESAIKSGAIHVAAATDEGSQPVRAEVKAALPPEPVLTRALPEELQNIAAKWPKLATKFRGPYQDMQGAKLSVTDDDKLLLVFTDSFAYAFANDDGKGVAKVKEVIADEMGLEVEVELKLVESQKDARVYPDLKKIFENKNIPIEFED